MNITFDSMNPDEFEPVSLQKLEGADPKKDPLQVLESCVDVLTELSTITQWDSQQADAKLEALFATHGDDFKTASREYFSANLQGMSVLTSIGPVRMSAKSKGKVHDRMRKTKALAVPRIPEILMHGEVSDFIPLHKERSDNSEGFYEFKKWLEFPDFKIEAMIKVSQDAQGKLLYYLAAAKQKSPNTGSMLGSEPQSAETGLDANKQFDTASSGSSKPNSDDEVNIEILQVVTTATGKVIQEEDIESNGPAIAFGRANNVKTAKGTKIATVFALVEADDLIASHDAMGGKNPKFPQELQPRDRGRESSQAWVQKVAANIDPESLGRTGRADSGAPIVGDDLVVESGNGRTMAIQLAYERDSAGEYRDWLIDESEYFGFTPEQVKAMKKPVLVRVRKTAIDRAAFAVEANQSDMLSFTATERAKSDAKRIDENLIQLFLPSEDGDLLAGSNQKFIQGFLKSLGEAEAAQYITKEGKPTQALVARIKAAVFKKAYNDDRLLEMVADQTKPDLQNMLNALSVAAPKFIESQAVSRANTEELSSSIVDGIEQAIDQRVVNAIVDAANVVMTAKNNNQDVAEFVKQQGLFGDMPEGVPELAVFIAQNSRSAKKMSVFFKAMADYLEKQAIDSQNHGLFGEPEPVLLSDVIQHATGVLNVHYGDKANIDMFDSATDPDIGIQLINESNPVRIIELSLTILKGVGGTLTPDSYSFTGKVTRAARQAANNKAVALLRAIQNGDVQSITPEDKQVLSDYTGTGGNLVGEDGLKGSAYEYYTPLPVAQSMWDLLKDQGFNGGSVLDPSSGTGIFAASAPKGVLMQSVELSEISGSINQIVNGDDKHAVTIAPFEQVAHGTQDEIYDAVITNVPFGTNADRGKNKNLDPKYQGDTLEEYFIKRSLDKLRPNGFAAFIVPTKILDNTSFKKFRQIVLLRADLLGAYRLPNKVFDATGADVTTDIIVLRKFSEGIADKINNLYENGGLAILKEAQVLNADIIAGRYFQKMGKQYILGETAKGKGRFGEVERVINDDSLSNILKLVKRFPDSRIDLSLLDATEELEPVTFNEGDIRQIDGATFELKGGEWTQVAKNLSFDEGRFNSPFAMLDGKVTYSQLTEYMGFMQSTARTIPDWIAVLNAEASIQPDSFGYWLCILSIIDALKQKPQAAYAEVYPALTNYMVGYATNFNAKAHKTKNPDYKRFIKLAEIAFDPVMPDGISGYWRGTESEDLNDKPLHARAAYESAIYRGIAENWQVDVDFIRETDPDFSPLANDEYAVNEDGTKVTLSRDYYVGNYASFQNKIDVQIAAATDPGIKEKLLRQKQKAADLIPIVDVKKVQYDLLSTVVPMDLKYRYFSEFIDDSVILDADDRLELDEKIETVNDLVKYRLGSTSILAKPKMDESNSSLRHFMLNRIFNSINNNQRLYVKTDETISKEVKTALLRILTDYFNTLNASFDAWLKSNDVFMNQLDIAFNAPENKTFPVELDDSPLVIEGFNPKKEGFQALNGYQNEEIRRLSRNFAGICGFDVGLGKTLTALAVTQNMHNMGVKKRTFFVVPPHTISKWFNDMKMAYDATDDVLVIGSNQGKQDAVDSKFNAVDFALLTKPTGNKYRKILLTVDAFNMIPLREATITKHYEQTEAYQSDRKQDAEKQDGTLSSRIKKINKYESKLPYFEDMAIDSLIFDEAQLFKNGKAGGGNFDRVKGLSLLAESTLSSRAISAAVKAWYVRGQNGELNDGVVLLTATPFTNSPVEILTMLSLAVGDKEALRNLGGASITNVEDFLSTFANVEAIEAENIVGDLTSVDTFTGFKNVHLLKDSIHSIANIQTARERGLKIPDEESVAVAIDIPEDDQAVLNQMKSFYELAKQHVDGGAVLADVQQITAYEAYKAQTGETDEILAHPFNLISRMSDVIVAGAEMGLMRIVPVDFDPQQLALATVLADSFNKKNITIKTQRRYPGVDSDLITTKALKNNLGELFDQFTIQCRVTVDDNNNRLILNVDDAGVVAQLMELVDQQGLTIQPKISAKVQAMVENFKVEQLTPKHMGFAKQLIFCDALAMQHIIKRALIAYCGLKPGQIAIINAQTLPDGTKGTPDTEHVQEVQDKFASNEFTVVIANKKAETGIDLQIGTQAIHHITTGWTPDSIQQRNGRGVRQGNQQKSLNVYFYNANGTFDEYKQRLIAGKADWIDKLMQKGGDISGTLTISRELSKEDYEDLIKADSPEQIAALLKAKSDREENQRATAVNNKTRLLYDNMIKAKKRPKPTVGGQVRKIMEFDAKKLSELIKKRDKAVKQDVIDRYTKLIQDISNKYDGWFDGYLTAGDVVASIQRELGSRGHKFDSYDIYRRMNAKDANGMRYDPQGWIDRNADSLINDVFNRARNIVSTADNMVAATKESFMNFQDNGYSAEEKQALANGSAVIDALGVIWFNHDYIKIESADVVGYGFVEVVESSNQSGYTTKMTYAPLRGSTLASQRVITRVEPGERAKAIEYMVATDIAECESAEHFDIDTVKPFYSRSLEEIRNIVAARLVPLGEEWGEKTSKLSARMLVDKNTQRRYWDIVYLPETRELNPEIVNAYNGPFKFESYDIQDDIGYAFIRNKDLKQYSKMFNLNVSGFFDRELSGYLLSNNLQVTFSKNESLDLLDKELSTYMRMLNMARPMEIDLVKPIKESELIPIIERFVNIALHRAVKNLREVTEWYVASESFARIKLHLRIVSDAGDEVTPNLFEHAQKIATQNTRGQMVVGLKSRVDGKFDNPLFENKESLKRVADYAYWSGRKAMWIIDLDSFNSVSNQQWYDSNKIDIVEAQYK